METDGPSWTKDQSHLSPTGYSGDRWPPLNLEPKCVSEQVTVKAVPFCKASLPRWTCGCGTLDGNRLGRQPQVSSVRPWLGGPQESPEGALGQGSLAPVRGVAIGLTELPGPEAPVGARMSPKGNQLLSDII